MREARNAGSSDATKNGGRDRLGKVRRMGVFNLLY
jgi:hypothetical protein